MSMYRKYAARPYFDAGQDRSTVVDACQPFKVRASCGHIVIRKMREATAGVPYTPEGNKLLDSPMAAAIGSGGQAGFSTLALLLWLFYFVVIVLVFVVIKHSNLGIIGGDVQRDKATLYDWISFPAPITDISKGKQFDFACINGCYRILVKRAEICAKRSVEFIAGIYDKTTELMRGGYINWARWERVGVSSKVNGHIRFHDGRLCGWTILDVPQNCKWSWLKWSCGLEPHGGDSYIRARPTSGRMLKTPRNLLHLCRSRDYKQCHASATYPYCSTLVAFAAKPVVDREPYYQRAYHKEPAEGDIHAFSLHDMERAAIASFMLGVAAGVVLVGLFYAFYSRPVSVSVGVTGWLLLVCLLLLVSVITTKVVTLKHNRVNWNRQSDFQTERMVGISFRIESRNLIDKTCLVPPQCSREGVINTTNENRVVIDACSSRVRHSIVPHLAEVCIGRKVIADRLIWENDSKFRRTRLHGASWRCPAQSSLAFDGFLKNSLSPFWDKNLKAKHDIGSYGTAYVINGNSERKNTGTIWVIKDFVRWANLRFDPRSIRSLKLPLKNSVLLPDFPQRVVHRLHLLAGITGITDNNDQGGDLKQGLRLYEKGAKCFKVGAHLALGFFALTFGWFLIREDIGRRATFGGAFLTGIGGLSLLFCAQWLLRRFWDLIT